MGRRISKKKALSANMLDALRGAGAGPMRLHGIWAYGGDAERFHISTYNALRDRGLVDCCGEITDAGRAALAAAESEASDE